MIRSFLKLIAATALLLSVAQLTAQEKNNQRDLTGSWQGALSVGGNSLRIVFNIKEDSAGRYKATMDSPDQGAFGIPADSAIVRDSSVRIVFRSFFAEYNGTCTSNPDSIAGTWSQGGIKLPLMLAFRSQAPEPPKRPQEPKKPYPYNEEEVTFKNFKDGITLSGTLTMPSRGGPFPAVVMITGSGPEDRDETVFGHKPFLVLADYLTRRGIAVLRYDDRGTAKSTGNFAIATSVDFANDAKSAAAYLKTRKDVRKNRIGLVGHSEGGLVAPMIAADSKEVAFIVMMAGPGVPGDEIIHKQAALIALAAGATEEQVKKQEVTRRKLFNVVESGKDTGTIKAELRSLLNGEMDSVSQANPTAAEAAINAQVAQLSSPWFRYFLTYDPRPALKKVRCPVLALNGEKDMQVPPQQNLPEIESALRVGKNKDFIVRELPGLNHLFQTAITGAPSEYAKIEETISPEALKLIGDWILKRCR